MAGSMADCRIHRVAETLDDCIDIRGGDDVGRREDDMIALLAIDRAAHGIGGEPAGKGFSFYAFIDLERGGENLLGGTVGDEFERPEQAAAADVADMAVVAEPVVQRGFQALAHQADVFDQIILLDDALHFQGRGAGDGVGLVGLAVQEAA